MMVFRRRENIVVLKKIQVSGYINGVPTSINNNTLKQYFHGKKTEVTLNSSELTYWITEKFCIDKEIYEKALKIFNKKCVIKHNRYQVR